MRNSRWTNSPIRRNGQIVATKPNVAGDIEILKCLGRYPLLTIGDIAALTARSYRAVAARTNKLKRKPTEYIKVADSQREQPRFYQWSPQALQLAPRGTALLADLGFEAHTPKPAQHFIHQLTQSQTAASFETGARLARLRFYPVAETPIPVKFSHRSKDYDFNLTPDGGPIGLGYGEDLFRFVVFETDCASEPLTSSNRDRQAIETKFAAYLALFGQGLYEKHLKLPNLFVLFTSTTKTRVENMRDLLASMTTNYLNCFGFQVLPTILSGSEQPNSGWAVTRPWLRVTKPLNLGESHG
jgi:hypothetical protein